MPTHRLAEWAERPACLPSPWRIRNDGRYSVVYECAISRLNYRVLSPLEAMLVPFLDGTLAWQDVLDLGRDLLNYRGGAVASRAATDRSLEDAIGFMMRADWASRGTAAPSPSLSGDRRRLVPDFTSYRAPSLRLDRPLAIVVTLTNYCRTDCLYCFAERRVDRELSFREWVEVFDEARDNEIFNVDIGGGDLFARKDAVELLEEMVRRDFVFFISTKCPVDARLAARLAELGIAQPDRPLHLRRDLQFSIDSADPATADLLVGRRGHLQRVTDSVRNCVTAGLDVRVKCVLTGFNPDAAEGVADHFVPLGVRRFHFVQYGRTHYRHRDDLFLAAEHKAALPRQLKRLRARHPGVEFAMQIETDDALSPDERRARWATRNACSGGRLQMVIQANGDVILCDQIPQDAEHVISNVRRSGLMGAWRSPAIERYLERPRADFVGRPCFDCGEFDRCHSLGDLGYCFRDSLIAFGDMLAPPPSCPHQDETGLRRI
jgi:radical SAM protein with 4Fe4S-binding SPASM domain